VNEALRQPRCSRLPPDGLSLDDSRRSDRDGRGKGGATVPSPPADEGEPAVVVCWVRRPRRATGTRQRQVEVRVVLGGAPLGPLQARDEGVVYGDGVMTDRIHGGPSARLQARGRVHIGGCDCG
jgi:hypothetical protein